MMRLSLHASARVALALTPMLALASPLSAQAATSPTPNHSLVVSTSWLAEHLDDPGVVLLHVDHDTARYRAGHIPGARLLSYHAITAEVGGVSTELPPVDSLTQLFRSLGVGDETRVILTGPSVMAARAFFTLDYLGARNVALLEGGLTKWRAEGRAVSTETPPPARVRAFNPSPRRDAVASADWVLSRVGKPGISFLDTRTQGEYDGSGDRRGLPSEGHLAGARLIVWQTTMRDPGEFTPVDLPALQAMWRERVTPGDSVVTYCLVGYRASMTYFLSRYLGYPVRLYDGSYDEWSKKKLPVTKEATALLSP